MEQAVPATDGPPDELIIGQLGAAVLLCWHRLPLSVQGKILAQSDDMIGLAPVPGLREQIVKLTLRRSPRL